MASSCLLRMVAQNTRVLFRLVQKDTCFTCLPSTTYVATITTSSCLNTSFVGKVSADQLWQGVTSVSNAGRKRGRGRSVKRRINLNFGQKMGAGKSSFVFPGLTGPALQGKRRVEIYEATSKDDEGEVKKSDQKKKMSTPPLLRGYSGKKYPGTSIGPPDPINDYVFEGFDSKVLEYKMVSHMTGNLGRKMRVSALVITGNGQGLAGYAVAKAPMGRAALRKAKNMAAQRLQFFERYNKHTVFHNFAVTEGRTTVFVRKMPKGHGLHCHKIIKTICEIIGIEDLEAKVEGNTNKQNMIKAFFRGLMEQESHQQLADRLQLNVVEFRPELENIPIPVARPSQGFSTTEPIKEEAFDFENMYYKDGKIPLKKYVDPMEQYEKLPSLWKHFLKQHRDRNQMHARYLRIVHGLEPSMEDIQARMKPLK